jgi:hypothetical protein
VWCGGLRPSAMHTLVRISLLTYVVVGWAPGQALALASPASPCGLGRAVLLPPRASILAERLILEARDRDGT